MPEDFKALASRRMYAGLLAVMDSVTWMQKRPGGILAMIGKPGSVLAWGVVGAQIP